MIRMFTSTVLVSMLVMPAVSFAQDETPTAKSVPSGSGGKEYLLWPGGAPGSEGKTGDEKLILPGDKVNPDQPATSTFARLSNVHRPSVTAFLPPADKATGTGVVIYPGGGHAFLAIDIEGYNNAKYLNSLGVAAFVVKYRLAREPGSTYQIEKEALADAQRAVRFVRSKAKDFGIDPARLGVMGFSTGGQLTAMTTVRFDAGLADAADQIDRASSRPDFAIMIYPANIIALGTEITKQTPPVFMLAAFNDNNPARMIPDFFLKLKAADVNAELHVYASGGHGFGLREKPASFPSTQTWFLRMADWLGDRGLLKKP